MKATTIATMERVTVRVATELQMMAVNIILLSAGFTTNGRLEPSNHLSYLSQVGEPATALQTVPGVFLSLSHSLENCTQQSKSDSSPYPGMLS